LFLSFRHTQINRYGTEKQGKYIRIVLKFQYLVADKLKPK
jgi:hypothetical protein